MSKVPDAWADDWVTEAQKAPARQAQTTVPKVLSRSERKTQHEEANKKLWDSAENPDRNLFLEAKGEVPLKTDFKPQLKVLSRKPIPATTATNGVAGLSLQDEDDSEEEERKKAAVTLAERQKRAAAEREEKQRKYAEARERIMGPSVSSQAVEGVKSGSNSRQSSRRGRASGPASQSRSPAERSPAPTAAPTKQLYEPSYAAKPRDVRTPIRSSTPKDEQPIRMPRGPDSSGRGGFAPRGGRAT